MLLWDLQHIHNVVKAALNKFIAHGLYRPAVGVGVTNVQKDPLTDQEASIVKVRLVKLAPSIPASNRTQIPFASIWMPFVVPSASVAPAGKL